MRGPDQLRCNLQKLALVLILCVPQAAQAEESGWPRLAGANPKDGICSEALEIARSAYRSDNTYLYQLPVVPPDVDSAFVLQPSALDISEGDALIGNPSVFQKIPKTSGDGNVPRSLYWQIKPENGLRYVMSEDSFGWRGDQYTLFALKDDVSSKTFMESYSRDSETKTFVPVIDEGWRPPLVLQEKSGGALWVVDVGAPYTFLSDWRVYSIGADGAKQRCTVQFHPQAATETSLLPSAVGKLATLLDGTLGSGENEGTLQETARLKTEVMHTWANVAMRPWAAQKAQRYNSRAKVDADLKTWSRKAASFRKLYDRINAQYPKAERSLAKYYETGFHKKPDEARALARQTLDIAMRMYFVFPQ